MLSLYALEEILHEHHSQPFVNPARRNPLTM